MFPQAVVRDPGDGGGPRDVVEQGGDHELGVVVPPGEGGTLEGVLKLIDRLAVVGQPDHRPAGADDLLDDLLGSGRHDHGSV
jgi:hypothetical protein